METNIKDAFEIYGNLHETQQNEFVINAVLNCCKRLLKTKGRKRSDIDFTIKVINHMKNSLMSTNDNQYIYAKNSLIHIYGNYLKDISNAFYIFNSIPSSKKNISCINSMMTAYNNNKQYLNMRNKFLF